MNISTPSAPYPNIPKTQSRGGSDTLKATYGNGPLLTDVEVIPIFWGSKFIFDPMHQALIPKILAFFNFVLSSPFMDFLSTEYSVGGKTIHHGSLKSGVVIPDDDPNGTVSDPNLAARINHWISQNRGIPDVSNEQQLYFIFPQEGISLTDELARNSCSQWCGYHWFTKSSSQKKLFYAVVPIGCSGCPSGLNVIDTVTFNITHELAESITSPFWNLNVSPPQPEGWSIDVPTATSLDSYFEIADVCTGEWEYAFDEVSGFYFAMQKVWSNSTKACYAPMWTGATFPAYSVVDAPAILGSGYALIVAWTDRSSDRHLQIRIMNNLKEGAYAFSEPLPLSDPLTHNLQYSRDSPALSEGPRGRTYIAWTGIDSPQHNGAGHLNIMSAINLEDWGSKQVIKNELSPYGPALAYGGGFLFLAWAGTDNKINLRRSSDGITWDDRDKIILSQWTIDSPSLAFIHPNLYLVFRSSNGNNLIFVAKSTDFGKSFPLMAAIPNQTTDYTPALTASGSDLILCFRATDQQHHIVTLRSDLTPKDPSKGPSADPITTFGNQRSLGERANGAISATNYLGQPFIGWADPVNQLNIMPLVFQ